MLLIPPVEFHTLEESTTRSTEAVLEVVDGVEQHLINTLYIGLSFTLAPICILERDFSFQATMTNQERHCDSTDACRSLNTVRPHLHLSFQVSRIQMRFKTLSFFFLSFYQLMLLPNPYKSMLSHPNRSFSGFSELIRDQIKATAAQCALYLIVCKWIVVWV